MLVFLICFVLLLPITSLAILLVGGYRLCVLHSWTPWMVVEKTKDGKFVESRICPHCHAAEDRVVG